MDLGVSLLPCICEGLASGLAQSMPHVGVNPPSQPVHAACKGGARSLHAVRRTCTGARTPAGRDQHGERLVQGPTFLPTFSGSIAAPRACSTQQHPLAPAQTRI